MKPLFDTLLLTKPLRQVRLKGGAGEDARPAAEEELRASYERGRREAEQALSQQLFQQRAEVHELMDGVLASMRQAVPQVVRETEDALIALSLSVAQKLVAGIPISTAMIEGVVRDALAQVEGTSQFTIRLHPEDLDLLQKSGTPLLAEEAGGKEFRFLSSAEVTRGGCLVQTQFGIVDARRETKFDLLQRTLSAS
ncbi:MAG TPA: FliH/SctL family protein [Verrucomicrobiae bacterium]|jgi:flagellar biosynthesis/type III secretory pathway protein FliH